MAIKFPQLKKTPNTPNILAKPQVSLTSPYAAPTASIESMGQGSAGNYNDSKFYSTSGRIGRIKYLLYPMALTFLALVIFMVALMALGGLAVLSNSQGSGLPLTLIVLVLVLLAALFYINIVCAIRRLHDLNRSGWLAILLFVPVISNFFPFYLMLAPGDIGRNDYGLPAAPPTTLMKVLAILMFGGVIATAIGAAIALPAYQQQIESAKKAPAQVVQNQPAKPMPTAQPAAPAAPVNGAASAPAGQPNNELAKPLMVDNSTAAANPTNAPAQSDPTANAGVNFAQTDSSAPQDNKKAGKISDEEFVKLSEGKIYADPVHAKKQAH